MDEKTADEVAKLRVESDAAQLAASRAWADIYRQRLTFALRVSEEEPAVDLGWRDERAGQIRLQNARISALRVATEAAELLGKSAEAEREKHRTAIGRDVAQTQHLAIARRDEAEVALLEAAIMAQRKEGLTRLLVNLTAANERLRAEYEREQEGK